MKLKDLSVILEKDFPLEAAVSWDHVGLLVGDPEAEISSVLLSLDVDDAAVEAAKRLGAELIISHHPLIFMPLERVTDERFLTKRIRTIIRADLNAYAIHTNFDILKMGELNAADLGIRETETLEVLPRGESSVEGGGFGKIGHLQEEMSLSSFAERVKTVSALPAVRVYGDPAMTVRKAAVSSGSGKSCILDAVEKGADVLVTGDLDYHNALDAKAMGLALIDGGHYGTEYVFMRYMKEYLSEKAPGLQVYTQDVRQPYTLI